MRRLRRVSVAAAGLTMFVRTMTVSILLAAAITVHIQGTHRARALLCIAYIVATITCFGNVFWQ